MSNQSKQVSLTDDSQSLDATEFVWNSEDDVAAHNYILPTVLRRLRSSNAKRILDLGCGNGSMTRALIKAGFSVVGVDPSVSGIEQAQRAGVGDYRCLSVDEPLPEELNGAFDAVVSTEVIEHLLLPRNLFHRAKEATQGTRGFLVVSTPFHSYLKNLAIALCNKFDSHWHPLRDYGHVKFFSRDTLTQLFREQHVSVENVDLVGRIPALAKSMIVSGWIENEGSK